jgi:hypothetical protein
MSTMRVMAAAALAAVFAISTAWALDFRLGRKCDAERIGRIGVFLPALGLGRSAGYKHCEETDDQGASVSAFRRRHS